MSTQQKPASPELYFETINAYQRTAALLGAIDLDLFTAVGEGNATPAEIAARCGADARATRILCDFLTIAGFLTKEDGRYGLTTDSAAFLDRRSPMYIGGTSRFLHTQMIQTAFSDVAALVRKGGTLLPGHGSVEDNNPVWVEFARSMAPMMIPAAHAIAGMLALGDRAAKVLDVAAGHGMFGVTVASQSPNVHVTALDWPAVLDVAKENAQAAGVLDRYTFLPGSAFDVDLGEGYDAVLLTNFLHHFDLPTCEQLAARAYAALAPGRRAFTLDFIPEPDRVTPPSTAGFALVMLATTARGDAYTFAELETVFSRSGFERSEFHALPPTMQQAVVSYKR